MSQVRDKGVGCAVRKGYKQTEIGRIPEDWEVKRLREISPKQSVGLVINPSTYFTQSGTVPMLVGSNVYENFIDVAKAKRISAASNDSLPASRLNAGDLVMVRVGDPGVSAVVPLELDGCNCASMMIVRRSETFNSYWLCHLMNSSAGRQEVLDVQYGTAQKQFNISDAVDFLYAVPPRSEQDAIAEAISDVDATLNALSRMIVKKRNLKQAAMQQLLTGQTRLPGFGESQDGFQDTSVGPAPSDWIVSSVGAEFDIQLGKMLDAEKNFGIPKCYLGNRAVQWGRIDVAELSMMPMSNTDLIKFRLHDGDLLVCEGGDVGRAAIWKSQLQECYFQKALHRLRAKENFNSALMVLFLKRWSELGVLRNYVTQTSIAHLPKDKFETIPLPKPSPDEQTAIASVLSDMDAEIEKLETRLEKTRMLKQGMMQELLTGRTRLI